MSNDTFQWNDALVKEYLDTRLGDTYKDLEDFKRSKQRPPIGVLPEWLWKETRLKELQDAIVRYQSNNIVAPKEWVKELGELSMWLANRKNDAPKKEWEVLKIKNKHGGSIYKEEKYSWEDIGVRSFDEYKIISVKRLSDNEVFTVGDVIGWGVVGDHETRISSFSVTKDGRLEIGHVIIDKQWFVDFLSAFNLHKKNPKKERIEVEVKYGYNNNPYIIESHSPRVIHVEKFPAIKAAIEGALNDEEMVSKDHHERVCAEKNIQYAMLMEQLKEAEVKAFNAGRDRIGGFWNDCINNWQHRTFQDYINHQRDKK